MGRNRDEQKRGYTASPELEKQLLRERSVTLKGGRYIATVTRIGQVFEAWTESPPFAYGRQSPTLQGALDSLEEEYRKIEETPQSPTSAIKVS